MSRWVVSMATGGGLRPVDGGKVRAMATGEADTQSASEPVVRDAPAASRYELVADGEVIGHAAYHQVGDRLVVPHVEVDRSLRGGGLAAVLMAGVVADARARRLRVDPLCP